MLSSVFKIHKGTKNVNNFFYSKSAKIEKHFIFVFLQKLFLISNKRLLIKPVMKI